MYRISKVFETFFYFLVVFAHSYGHSISDNLAMWGMKSTPFANGLIFSNIYKVQIEVNFTSLKLDAPQRLDCDKYVLHNLSPSSSRRKRQINNPSPCAYDFNPSSKEAIEASESEELKWINLTNNDPITIFCDSIAENCLLRRLHTPNFTLSWHKKFNLRSRKFTIEPSYLIHNPPKPVPVTKEILYTTESTVELAKNGHLIMQTYVCMGDPYSSQNIAKDPLFVYVEKNREQLFYKHLGQAATNSSKLVSSMTSKQLIESRQIIDQLPPPELNAQHLVKYEQLNRKIKSELTKLNLIEKKISDEVCKLDDQPDLFDDQFESPQQCKEWFNIKEKILKLYEERNLIVINPTPIQVQMTKDLTIVCATALLMKVKLNALDSVNKVESDFIQRQTLSLLGIDFKLNEQEWLAFKSKIEKFNSLPVPDSVKVAIIEVNKQKHLLKQEVEHLNMKVFQLQELIRSKDEHLDQLSTNISIVNTKMQKEKLTSEKFIRMEKEIRLNQTSVRNQLIDLSALVTKKLVNFRRILNPEQLFLKEKKEAIYNDTETQENNLQNSKLQHLNSEFDQITHNLTVLQNLTHEYAQLLIESNLTLQSLLAEQNKSEALRTTQLHNLSLNQQQMEQLHIKLRKLDEEWKSKYQQVILEKRSLKEQLDFYSGQDQKKTTMFDHLTTKINKLEDKVNQTEYEIGGWRIKRSVQDKIGIDMKRHCEQVNKHIDQIVKSLQFEEQKLDQNLRKKRSSLINALWKTGSYTSFFGLSEESYARETADVILKESIEKTYSEFLNQAKIVSKFGVDMETARQNMDSNLQALNSYAKDSSVSFQRIADELNDIKEYQLSNRIWILFHAEVINIQRLLINYIQQNSVKNRIADSIQSIKAGYLTKDFINSEKLHQILEMVKLKLPKDQQLAFGLSELEEYYRYPFSSIKFEKDQKIIEIRIPTISHSSILKKFKLDKIKTHAINCWDPKKCEANKNYRLKLHHDIVFNDKEQIIHSSSLDELECMQHFEHKLCWLKENEENVQLDTCLKEIFQTNQASEECNFETTSMQVVPIRIDSNKMYETFRDSEGLLIGKIINLVDNTVIRQLNVYDHIKAVSLKTPHLATFNFEEDAAYKKLKITMAENQEEMLKQYNYFKDRTLADFQKETKLDNIKVIAVNSDWKWVSMSSFILPYLLGSAILIFNGQIRTFGAIAVIAHTRGAHAWNPTDLYNDWAWGKAKTIAKEKVKNLGEAYLDYVIIITTIIVALYVLYRLIYKVVTVENYYGRIAYTNTGQSTKWNIVLSTILQSNSLFWHKIKIITITQETSVNPHFLACTANVHSIWLVEENALRIMDEIEVHNRAEAVYMVDKIRIDVDKRQIVWNEHEICDLNELHGQVVSIRMERLSNFSHPTTIKY